MRAACEKLTSPLEAIRKSSKVRSIPSHVIKGLLCFALCVGFAFLAYQLCAGSLVFDVGETCRKTLLSMTKAMGLFCLFLFPTIILSCLLLVLVIPIACVVSLACFLGGVDGVLSGALELAEHLRQKKNLETWLAHYNQREVELQPLTAAT